MDRRQFQEDLVLSLLWKVLLEYICLASQGKFLNTIGQLPCPVDSQSPFLNSRVFGHTSKNRFLEDILEDCFRLEEMRIDDGNTGVKLIQIVLQGCTSQEYSLLAFEGLYLFDEFALLVLQAMSFVEYQEIALLAESFTVLVEVLVTDYQEPIVILHEISYYFCDFFAGAQSDQRTEFVSHPFGAFPLPNLEQGQRADHNDLLDYFCDDGASNERQGLQGLPQSHKVSQDTALNEAAFLACDAFIHELHAFYLMRPQQPIDEGLDF